MDEDEKTSREAVIRRDRGRCVVCGRSANDVHEIIPRSALPGEANKSILFSIQNRVCLCRDHHGPEVHTVWGRVMFLGLLHLRFGYRYNKQPFKRYFEVRTL